jgi:hypothetical protein
MEAKEAVSRASRPSCRRRAALARQRCLAILEIPEDQIPDTEEQQHESK